MNVWRMVATPQSSRLFTNFTILGIGLMPRGAKPGERRGGRAKGTVNRATVERALVAERIINEASMAGRKLGKERLEEFMEIFGGLAGAFQPQGTGPGEKVTPQDLEAWAKSYKEPMFEKYAKLAFKAASDLADFQSPKFAPVHVAAPPPEKRARIEKRFTLSIFDHKGRPAPRHIHVKPSRTFDANANCDGELNGDEKLLVPTQSKFTPRKH
jgi:hypothetical protein